jgi:hypothetical protein
MAWAIGIAAVAMSARLFLLNALNSDFASFYESAAAWRTGASPYVSDFRVNLNPPLFLWLFAPFTWWPLETAASLWLSGQVIALLLLVELTARGVASRSRQGALLRGLILVALAPLVPLVQLLREGQWILWLAVIVTAAWRSARSGRPRTAGVLLGMAIAIRPFAWWFWLALPTPFQPALLAAGAAGAGVTILASYLTGPDLFREWLALSGALTVPHVTHWLNLSVPGHLARTFGWSWTTGTIVVTLAFVSAFVWRVKDRRALRTAARHHDSTWWFASLATVLASPLGWAYYALLGAAPAIAHVAAQGRLTPLMLAGWIGLLAVWVSVGPLALATWIWTAALLCWTVDALRARFSPSEGAGSEDPASI